MKVLDVEFGKVPSLLALVIRESILGLGAMLAAIALNIFLPVPVIIYYCCLWQLTVVLRLQTTRDRLPDMT
ncbi:hypothetical protein [Chroogloeocystis siderophila]|jgi:hypothetical protein|uniref:hypothetical protein n=1 Tax=Chroogloeocystis siderophila TaxID=329163 RepID=UPI001C4A5CA7|nr:hypothetical protein [Chroogloeocystis siderophila]